MFNAHASELQWLELKQSRSKKLLSPPDLAYLSSGPCTNGMCSQPQDKLLLEAPVGATTSQRCFLIPMISQHVTEKCYSLGWRWGLKSGRTFKQHKLTVVHQAK